MEGAFWIVASGYGLQLETKKFVTPSEEDAKLMAENTDPYGCCTSCHWEMDGSFYQTSKVCVCILYDCSFIYARSCVSAFALKPWILCQRKSVLPGICTDA